MSNDLISRSALLAEYDRVHVGEPGGARKLIEEAPAVDAAPKWISVREKLPERCKRVLVHIKRRQGRGTIWHDVMEGTLYNDGWEFDLCPAGYYMVTHWMPLPKPPDIAYAILDGGANHD